jgi:hypothetical protein
MASAKLSTASQVKDDEKAIMNMQRMLMDEMRKDKRLGATDLSEDHKDSHERRRLNLPDTTRRNSRIC